MAETITAALTAIALAVGDVQPVESGYLSSYAPGVFQRTIQVRIDNGYGTVPEDWQSYDGYWAGLDCAKALAGVTVWARPGEGYPWSRLLYADCSGHQSTTDHFISNGIIGEVDAEMYQEWKDAGYWTERGLTVEVIYEQ